MKKILYLLPFLSVFYMGCGPSSNTPTPTSSLPLGTFTGPYTYIHTHFNTGVHDTTRGILQLSIENATGYSVTGDTSKHAGSYGACYVNPSTGNINFVDKTAPASGTTAKIHLNGFYQYSYDGANFQLVQEGALDTTAIIYNFKKTGS
jgi:hypothetical protein